MHIQEYVGGTGFFPGIKSRLINEKLFLLSSPGPLRILTSALLGADLKFARHIFNYTVAHTYNKMNPREDLETIARRISRDNDVVGLMTAVYVKDIVLTVKSSPGLAAAAFSTVGLGNPGAAGYSAELIRQEYKPGTINSIVLIDGNLSMAALVNGVITATEAKTRALVEAGLKFRDGTNVTGTTTDTIAIACTIRGAEKMYAGTATDLGYLIGSTVYESIREGIRKIKLPRGSRR
ncbi:MAG: adenosylcobinamide amidohydrolase [Peptococcaceae bacterium]